jgi:tape measure domain-containing protein
MAGYSLGTAWIQISPSMKGMRSSIERELGGVSTRPAEQSIVSGLGGAFKQVGSIATAALGAAAAIGVGMGFADVASQALNAADATLKFKNTLSFAGIASDQIEALTASTKEYADKTVYGLDDIQNITAQLASNGVAGYDKLAEAAGNLNAVAGGNAETFKSVGMVLTQTAGQGKLTTENWNQLSDAIPGASGKIQQALLDAGAYTGNFRDAMAKGEITAEEFNAAIMDLGMTDVAKEAATSTQTMEGAWGNFEATMVTGAQQIAERALPYITGALSKMSEWATKAFDWINTSLIPSLSSLWNILAKGDFTGPIFGLEEDSGFVDFLFNVRDAAMAAGQWISSTLVPSIQSVYNIIANGDFTGPIFGLEEDSGLVAFLFDMREAAISLWETLTGSVIPGVTGFLSDVASSSAFSTVTSFFGALATNEGVLLAVVGAFTAWKVVMAGISLASFIASVATGTAALITNTGAWIANTAAMIASKAQTVVLMGMYAGEFVANLVKTGVQLGIQAGAWIATTAAQAAHTVVGWANIAMQGAAKVATVGWTAAQWLLNAALNANPIGIVVIAIAALVAGLIYAWNNSETFRNVVMGAWEGIKTAVGVVVDWLSTNVWPIIQSVWGYISSGAQGLWGILVSVWNGIWSAISGVVEWISANAWPAIQAAWGYISAGAQGLWSVITTVWTAIWGAISAVVSWLVSTAWPLIQGVWDWIKFGAQLLWFGIQLYWAAIRIAISVVVDWLVNTAWPFIQNVWSWISTGASALWSYIQSAWNGIKTAIGVVADWLTGTVWPVISAVWEGIKAGAALLWTYITTAWNGIRSAISAVADWLTGTVWPVISAVWEGIKAGAALLWTYITTAWNGIRSAISAVADWLYNTLWTRVSSVWNGIKTGAEKLKDAIGTAFDKIKEKTARPINFVIGTVYTNGIKKLVDGVMEKVGLDLRMPDVPQVGGYASGGVLPGYTPGKDIYHFVSHDGGGRLALSGGEAIMRPEWVRAIGGPRMVDAMNRAASGHRPIPGGDVGIDGYRGFAPGGVWDDAKKRLAGIGRSIGSTASWVSDAAEAVGSILSDPAGAIENLVWQPVKTLLDGHSDTGAFWEAGKAIPKKIVDGVKDWFVAHAPAPSGGADGPVDLSSATDLPSAARAAIGTPYVWGGSSVPGGVDCSGLVYWAAKQLGWGWPRLTAAGYQAGSRPGNSNVPGNLLFWGYPAHHVAIASGGGRMIEAPTFGVPVREIAIYGGPSAGVYGYDDGGWLQPGGTMAINATGRPEAVMTSSQWDKIDRLIGALENGLLSQRDLIVRDADGELVGRMRTEAEGAIIDYDRMRG